ncbi:MAG: ester cyclase [Chloroflexota bacterium]|nr:ester cyclase [Chloroflexota bacterium]
MAKNAKIEVLGRLFGGAASRREVTRTAAGALLGAAGLAQIVSRPAAAQEATPAADAATCPETTEAENIALVQRYWDEVWTAGGEAAVADVFTADELHHWGVGGPTVGPDAFAERLVLFLTAFPDFAIQVDDAFADGDMVVTRYTATGTHQGTWLGIEPTGTSVEYTGMNVFRLECGKIAESWGEANHLSLLRQLGGLPEATPPEATPTT